MGFGEANHSTQKDHWATPKEFYKMLDNEFSFDLDPCPLKHDITKWNGLEIEWGSRNFVNPPYSQLEKWLEKGYKESLKGKIVVFLMFSRTDNYHWHKYCMKAQEIRFIRSRLSFIDGNTGTKMSSSPTPSCLVIFNQSKKDEKVTLGGIGRYENEPLPRGWKNLD